MFNGATKRLEKNIVHVFKDWTEATDFISKRRGIAHLRALMDWVDFPSLYGMLICISVREPQDCKEVQTLTCFDQGEKHVVKHHWNGPIREGFMMGLQITKVVLHLIHMSEQAVVFEFLRRRGIHFQRPMGYGRRPFERAVQLPRQFEDGAEAEQTAKL